MNIVPTPAQPSITASGEPNMVKQMAPFAFGLIAGIIVYMTTNSKIGAFVTGGGLWFLSERSKTAMKL